MPDPRKKYITNRSEYEKRAASYKDSLALYNKYQTKGDSIPFIKYTGKDAPTDSYIPWENASVQLKNANSGEKINPSGIYLRRFKENTSGGKTLDGKDITSVFWPKYVKPQVEPVLKTEKTNVPNRPGIVYSINNANKIMRSLPRSIDKIAYDASGTTVYVTINGEMKSMPKKDFVQWRAANENLYNDYLKRK